MKAAVLGLGSIGLRHAENLIQCGVTVIGYDPENDRVRRMENIGGIKAPDRDAALSSANCAVIATPNGQHIEDLARAIDAGCHVFIEKPIGQESHSLEAILDRAKESELVVFAGLNTRFNPAVIRARELMHEGRLGKIYWGRFIASSYLPDWRPWQDYRQGYAADPKSGGVVFDAIHEFDLAWYLLGPATVGSAVIRNSGFLDIKSDDCADIVLRHSNGVQCGLHMDYLTRPRRRRFEIAGEKGIIDVDVSGRTVVLTDEDGKRIVEEAFDSTVDQEYHKEIEAFIRCVENGDAPACDGYEALAVLKQVENARMLGGSAKS